MKTNFRQGLISYQQAGPAAVFLLSGPSVDYVSLNVAPQPLIATIAHGSSDYMLKFDQVVDNAWGPLVSGPTNYLYIEQNLISGALAFKSTVHEPISSAVEPNATAAGQLWFDLTARVMKTYNGTKWIDTPAVVVGKAVAGNTNQLIHYTVGSSVGLEEPGSPGFLMLDSQLRPLRTSTGQLLTTDTPVRIKTTVGTSGVLSEPVNGFVPVRANQPIPAMSLVYFSGEDSVSLASSDPSLVDLKTPIGVVEHALAINEVGTLTQAGEIVWDQWNFEPSQFGKPLYCGWNGQITTSRPQGVQAYRVGYVKNARTILFCIDSETKAQVVSQPGSIISGQPPLVSSTTVNGNSEIVTTLSILPADATHDGYMTSAQAVIVNTLDERIEENTLDIEALQTSKANTNHTHPIAQVVGLQTELTSLRDSIAFKLDRVGGPAGNFPAIAADGSLLDSGYAYSAFALANHSHSIAQVTNLQSELNAKAPLVHSHAIADVINLQSTLDGKAMVNHTHAIADINLLQTTLNNKAPVNHSHMIFDVNGLQEALDARSLLGHTHNISDVINLQSTLNGKANVVHTHSIADVMGLQPAIDNKANVAHTHVAADITNFSEAVDDRVASLIVAGDNISLSYNDDGNQLVISSSASQVAALGDLTDVDFATSPVAGDVLAYKQDGTWSSTTPVTIANSGQSLLWHPTTGDKILQAAPISLTQGSGYTQLTVGKTSSTESENVFIVAGNTSTSEGNLTVSGSNGAPDKGHAGGRVSVLGGGGSPLQGDNIGGGAGGNVLVRGGSAGGSAVGFNHGGSVEISTGQNEVNTGANGAALVLSTNNGVKSNRVVVNALGQIGFKSEATLAEASDLTGVNYGTAGQVLTATAGQPEWQTPTGGSSGPSPWYFEYLLAKNNQTVVNTVRTRTISNTESRSAMQVFVNGVLQMEGATKKYLVTGNNQLTFTEALQKDDDIAVFSTEASEGPVVPEEPEGNQPGTGSRQKSDLGGMTEPTDVVRPPGDYVSYYSHSNFDTDVIGIDGMKPTLKPEEASKEMANFTFLDYASYLPDAMESSFQGGQLVMPPKGVVIFADQSPKPFSINMNGGMSIKFKAELNQTQPGYSVVATGWGNIFTSIYLHGTNNNENDNKIRVMFYKSLNANNVYQEAYDILATDVIDFNNKAVEVICEPRRVRVLVDNVTVLDQVPVFTLSLVASNVAPSMYVQVDQFGNLLFQDESPYTGFNTHEIKFDYIRVDPYALPTYDMANAGMTTTSETSPSFPPALNEPVTFTNAPGQFSFIEAFDVPQSQPFVGRTPSQWKTTDGNHVVTAAPAWTGTGAAISAIYNLELTADDTSVYTLAAPGEFDMRGGFYIETTYANEGDAGGNLKLTFKIGTSEVTLARTQNGGDNAISISVSALTGPFDSNGSKLPAKQGEVGREVSESFSRATWNTSTYVEVHSKPIRILVRSNSILVMVDKVVVISKDLPFDARLFASTAMGDHSAGGASVEISRIGSASKINIFNIAIGSLVYQG